MKRLNEFGPRVEEGEGNAYNNPRIKQKLMKQFCQLEGPSGNSQAYLDGWEHIFGKKKYQVVSISAEDMNVALEESANVMETAEAYIRESFTKCLEAICDQKQSP